MCRRREPGQVDVAVVGAGFGGLGVALACAKAGLSVTILERRPELAITAENRDAVQHGDFDTWRATYLRRVPDAERIVADLGSFDGSHVGWRMVRRTGYVVSRMLPVRPATTRAQAGLT